MEHNMGMCAGMESKLADLLLDAETAPASVRLHVDACAGCRRELEELRATMGAMESWEVPEPNPYFMTRFEARLREEKKAAPAGWLEQLKARFAFGGRMQVRPLAAMALTVALLVGGGAYLDVYWQQPASQPGQTAVVHDLQTLDDNAQLLDELDVISGDTDQSQN